MADDASPDPDPAPPARLLAPTADIVSAQVRGDEVSAAELPGLVQAVYRTLDAPTRDAAEAEPPRPQAAVPDERVSAFIAPCARAPSCVWGAAPA